MRPRIPELRERYRLAVKELQESGTVVSVKAVSDKLGIKFHTVRTFMYRNPRLANELGLGTYKQKNGIEYLDAAVRVAQRGEKLNGYSLAQELERDHSAVYSYLRRNLAARAIIYKETGIRIGRGEIPDCIIPDAKQNLKRS